MGILIIIIISIILLTQAFICWVLVNIERWLAILCNIEPEEAPVEEEAKVTDPFQKPAPIHSSTSHIIVPKTPTEIRNQNFKKIKDGIEYGDIKQA